jgi:hypothetical protein
MSQITFPVILLFSFRELKRRVAFCTRDIQVWHGGFSKRVREARSTLFTFGAPASLFFTTVCVPSALVIKHYAEKLRVPIRLMGRVYSSEGRYTNYYRPRRGLSGNSQALNSLRASAYSRLGGVRAFWKHSTDEGKARSAKAR